MGENAEKAVMAHQSGCNCSQAVAATFCEKYGIAREDVMRMAAAFGGGMRRGEVCGAVTGALMVLGMKHGARDSGDKARKAEADAKTAEFMKTFQERHGSYLCRELIKAAGRKVCPEVIAGAADILDEFGC